VLPTALAGKGRALKLAVLSDTHLDAPFVWAGPEVARRRRRALRDALSRAVELAVELEVDAVLCGGDLYEHDRFSSDMRQFLRAAFEKLHPTPVYVSPGNHDWHGPQSLYSRPEWSPNVRIFEGDRLEAVTLLDGLTLWGAAHRAPSGAKAGAARRCTATPTIASCATDPHRIRPVGDDGDEEAKACRR